MAVGMTLVILIGGIDLSVGSVLALSGMVMGYLGERPALAVRHRHRRRADRRRRCCGLVSGLMVTRLQHAGVHRDAGDDVDRAGHREHHHQRRTDRWLSRLVLQSRHHPPFRLSDGDGRRDDRRSPLIAWIVLQFRPAGRALYAIGGSPEVARLAGIPVRQYTMLGLRRLRARSPGSRASFFRRGSTLRSRAPASATSSTRSRRSSSAARACPAASAASAAPRVGVLIIGFLRNGLNLLQVSPFVQQVIIGVVIAVAVAADTLRTEAR